MGEDRGLWSNLVLDDDIPGYRTKCVAAAELSVPRISGVSLPAGEVEVEAILAPTLNFVPGRGLRYALSFDDQAPQIVDALAHNSLADWEKSVEDSVRKVKSTFTLTEPGYHTLKVWMVDPGIVLQKLVLDLGGLRPSYLGPPESYHHVSRQPPSQE